MSATMLPPTPPALAAAGIGLRDERPEDADFLRRLYLSVRWEELETVNWAEEAKVAFLSQQFDFQTRHYRQYYQGAAFGIVTDGEEPVGRLYLHQGAQDLRIIDISLLPSHRGRGFGAALIGAVFELGRQAGTKVSIHVEFFNRNARRLYDRLGFVQGESNGVYYRMDWTPPELAAAS